jgi:hypothetical protein
MPRPAFAALIVGLTLIAAGAGPAKPVVHNGGFEADVYAKHPGYASANGGITAWRFTGNAGVNPWWRDPELVERPVHSFDDNGRTPQGRRVALMQNKCTLSQRVRGFKAGKRYRVTYYENARHNRQPEKNPRIKVVLGGEIVVSEHAIKPVDQYGRRELPYDFVESAVFTPPADGAYDLVFTTTADGGVTALLDRVQIVEVAA